MSLPRLSTVMAALSLSCLAPPLRAATPPPAAAGTARPAQVAEAYARLPLAFEENGGRTDPRVRYLSRGPGYTLFLTPAEVVLAVGGGDGKAAVVRMRFLGARRPEVVGVDALPGRINSFMGQDPAAWRAGVSGYGAVRYRGVYPGVDVLFHGRQRELEYDFLVAPGADPGRIRLRFDGARRLRRDAAGNLVIEAGAEEVVQRAPVAYQDRDGRRRPVAARFEVVGRREVAFRLGEYDRTRPLVIDPVLAYSTYLGGSSTERALGIAVDAAGSAYVAGSTSSLNFPTRNALQPGLGATSDAFVTKFSPAGNALVYSTYLGGASSSDGAQGIALDAAGGATLVGQTCSSDFPTVNPAQAAHAGGCDAFVARLSPSGAALEYATYLGGTTQDLGQAVAVDVLGNAYVTGLTFATNFPTLNPLQASIGSTSSTDAFVSKLSPAGALVYSTYLGGSSLDTGTAIAADAAGSAYVVGGTQSLNFPTANAYRPTRSGSSDAFLAKLAPAGNALVFSTYLGGNCSSGGTGVAVDGAGSAYVTGTTCSTNFPVLNALQPVKAAADATGDIFVTRFAPAGTSLVYSTYLGGSSSEIGRGIAVDADGNAYVTGWSFSTDFPTLNPVQASNRGPYDVVVAKLAAAGNALLYSTYLGGSDSDFGQTGGNGIAVDAAGNAYVANTTASSNFPTVNAFQSLRAGNFDGAVFKLTADPPPAVDPVARAGADLSAAEGSLVTLDATGSSDPNGDPLTYLWEQIAGPAVTLSDPTAPRPTFTAPTVPSGGATITFRLTVSDGTHTSAPDTVDVTITNVNQAPVAQAGGDQTVQEGSPVTLQAGDSFDPDGDPLAYQWTQTSGPTVELSDPTAPSPSFAAPLVGAAGATLAFTLTVSDGAAQSSDQVVVAVSNLNQVPIADAGLDQTVDEGALVTLQGGGSSDPDGDPLTYSWTQTGGTAVVLADAAGATPTFTAPAVGAGGETLTFALAVSDGAAGAADAVRITVRDSDQPPSCGLARASVAVLWPPTHNLLPVAVVGVADPDDGGVAITVDSVTQDEPVEGVGDGDTSPDAVAQGGTVLLRAERAGGGSGRVYTVAFTARDDSGATCTGTVTVCVPHAGRTGACLDEGHAHDSQAP